MEQPKRVFVEGSFNGWSKKSVNWELAETDEKVFMLECEKIDVQVPEELFDITIQSLFQEAVSLFSDSSAILVTDSTDTLKTIKQKAIS